MEYTRQETIGNRELYESYEGSPQEILELLQEVEKENECIEYVQEDAIDYILKDLDVRTVDRTIIGAILESEERYMRSVGIIID